MISASHYSNLVILVYDTILTLPREVVFLWGRKIRVAALLYIMARYMFILYYVAITIGQTTVQVFVYIIFHVEYYCFPY